MPKVKIGDCVDGEGVVRGRTFEDVQITGPAILVALGTDNRIVDCEIPYTPDQMAMVQFAGSVGGGPVVMVAGCTFRNCRFALDVDVSQLQSIIEEA
jgi:hypothetical protein